MELKKIDLTLLLSMIFVFEELKYSNITLLFVSTVSALTSQQMVGHIHSFFSLLFMGDGTC